MMLKKSNKLVFFVISILCFIYYGNTLVNDYALDDTLVLTDNQFTKAGFKGLPDIFKYDSFTGFFGKEKNLVAGGRYRPLSLASLAIEYQFFGKNPFISHFVNIVLYIITCFFIYLLLQKLIAIEYRKWYFSVPVIATLLFLIHPVHTEVVANIKGRDEMMTLIGALGAFLSIIKYFETTKKTTKLLFLGLSAISMFLALLSKENAITFLAIIPIGLYIFNIAKPQRILQVCLPMIFASVIFLVIRHNVLGNSLSEPITELLNNPFLYASTSQKFATIFYTLAIYIKLLFWPHPLTYDYYPYHIALVNWNNIVALSSLIFYVSLGIYMIWGIYKKQIIGFAIVVYLSSLSVVSNIVFPIGTFMNERFIFISSIGFVIIVAFILVENVPKLIKRDKVYFSSIFTLLGIVIISSAWKTIDRNKAWKNDLILFTTDVETSGNSAKSNCSAGGKLFEASKEIKDSIERFKILDKSVGYLRKSISIHPQYTDALLLLGNVLFEYQKYDSTLYYYHQILKVAPAYEKVYENVPIVVNRLKTVDEKIKAFESFYTLNTTDFNILYQLGSLYGKGKNDIKKATFYLEKAYLVDSNKKEVLKDLGVAYGFSGKSQSAIHLFERALQIDPQDTQIYFNLAVSYKSIGKEKEMSYYLAKFNEMNSKK